VTRASTRPLILKSGMALDRRVFEELFMYAAARSSSLRSESLANRQFGRSRFAPWAFEEYHFDFQHDGEMRVTENHW